MSYFYRGLQLTIYLESQFRLTWTLKSAGAVEGITVFPVVCRILVLFGQNDDIALVFMWRLIMAYRDVFGYEIDRCGWSVCSVDSGGIGGS